MWNIQAMCLGDNHPDNRLKLTHSNCKPDTLNNRYTSLCNYLLILHKPL